ncbi:MAG: GTP-binding protein [Planctomycetaceae bacterium]|nr:MAG: GTP-binding protein [Planctomycetaceae bacterium]
MNLVDQGAFRWHTLWLERANRSNYRKDGQILNKQAFVSLLTPPGRGAVATVVVGGQDCVACVAERFDAACGRRLDELVIDRIFFGRWRSREGPGEELVVCRRSDWVEIHGHGGRAAPASIIQDLVEDGCREMAWPDLLWQTSADPFAAEACIALTQARTQRTAAILMDQVRGALREQWEKVIRALESGDIPTASASMEELTQQSCIGLHLIQPYRVVLCGPPNVGKSTLINALLGYQRSIVYDQPGTTRDVLTTHTALEGWPIELSDTAGLRDQASGVEAEGVERSRQQREKADLVLLIYDASQSSPEVILTEGSGQQHLTIYNKMDQRSSGLDGEGIFTNALTGDGVGDLVKAIVETLVPLPPRAGQAVPFTHRQVKALKASQVQLFSDQPQTAAAILRAAARVGPVVSS